MFHTLCQFENEFEVEVRLLAICDRQHVLVLLVKHRGLCITSESLTSEALKTHWVCWPYVPVLFTMTGGVQPSMVYGRPTTKGIGFKTPLA